MKNPNCLYGSLFGVEKISTNHNKPLGSGTKSEPITSIVPAVHKDWPIRCQHVVMNSSPAVQHESCICALIIKSNHLKVPHNSLLRCSFLKCNLHLFIHLFFLSTKYNNIRDGLSHRKN